MYEMKNGSKRLIAALYSIADDEAAIDRLARLLQYRAPQLQEDIQALQDYVQELENKDRGK